MSADAACLTLKEQSLFLRFMDNIVAPVWRVSGTDYRAGKREIGVTARVQTQARFVSPI